MLGADIRIQRKGKPNVDKRGQGEGDRKTGIICGRPLGTTPYFIF